MKIKRIGDVALSIAALLGVLGILLGIVVAVFGVTPLVFRSGSMSPAINTGDLAFARNVPVKDLRVGDIVSVRTGGARVTHRVVAVDEHQLQLKGDANNVADAEPYTVTSADRVFAHVPKVGYAIAWAMSPLGMVISGVFAALLLFLALGSGRADETRSADAIVDSSAAPVPGTDSGGGIARSAVAIAGVAIFAVASTTTLAYWTDKAEVSARISSAAAPAPSFTSVNCAVESSKKNSNTFRLTWSTVSGATGYQIFVGAIASNDPGYAYGPVLPAAAITGTFQLQGNELAYAYVVATSSSWTVRSNPVRYNNFLDNPKGSPCS